MPALRYRLGVAGRLSRVPVCACVCVCERENVSEISSPGILLSLRRKSSRNNNNNKNEITARNTICTFARV